MPNVKKLCCLLLPFFFVALTAAGTSPLATQTAQIGPYRLLLSFYSLPRAGQQLNMTIGSKTPGVGLRFSQVMLNPAPSTDAISVRVALSPDSDTPGVYDVHLTPSVRGQWLLHLTVSGTAGSFTGDIPLVVQGPPVIPTWLGWLIGLTPLPLIVIFFWSQVKWRKTHRERERQEILQRSSP
jgi:hypothetical protein